MDPNITVTVRHWLPIVTICPVNNLPDLIYISVTHVNRFAELYKVRRHIKKVASFKRMFMEDIGKQVLEEFPDATEVSVRLAFNRHVVTLTREVKE